MNPDEKTENDLAAESDREENAAEGSAGVGSERAEEEQAYTVPDEEGLDGPEKEFVPEPEGEKRSARLPADGSKLKSILEAMIFVSEQPISLDRMAGVLTDCPRQKLKELLAELELDYQQRGGALEIVQVANGYQFRTRAEFAPWLGRLRQQKFARLSRAALETLAIVAYRQPVTRAEAESIRGVDSGAVLGTLLERRLIRILGRKEVAGRPILYGTTQDFLELFGLKNLKDLPTLREIKDMVDMTRQGPESQEGKSADVEDGAGEEGLEERVGPSAEERAAVSEHRDAAASAKKRCEDESDLGFEDEWSKDEEPLGEEEITPRELDEILKSTRTRLKLYEPDEEVEEETGQAGPAEAQGKQGADEPGEGGDPDED